MGIASIAISLNAKLIPPETDDPEERKLRNVVEEMAIASGISVPDIFLLEDESGINAFVAGYSPNEAIICVTRGAIQLLNRDELQGVVAHEFSHIFNGDMLLNIKLLGWLNGILVISKMGALLRDRSSYSDEDDSYFTRRRADIFGYLIGLFLYIVGYVGYFFAQIIKSAVSRKREFLADAAAMQFTRNPHALAEALRKIGLLEEQGEIKNPRAIELSHMFFVNGVKKKWYHLFDTHPPLIERIQVIYPRFQWNFPEHITKEEEESLLGFAPSESGDYSQKTAPLTHETAKQSLLETAGMPLQEHLELTQNFIQNLPKSLIDATHDLNMAQALIYGLILIQNKSTIDSHKQTIKEKDDETVLQRVDSLLPDLENITPRVRMPLIDLSLPILRTMDIQQFSKFKGTIEELIKEESTKTLFDFALSLFIQKHLEPRFYPPAKRQAQIQNIKDVQDDCSAVLTAVARIGDKDENRAKLAFESAIPLLKEPTAKFRFLTKDELKQSPLGKGLATLDKTTLETKHDFLAAALQCISYDKHITPEEIELFRAIADAIECPIPPWLYTAS